MLDLSSLAAISSLVDRAAPSVEVGLRSGNAAPLTFLPQDAGGESPACLDGSPYAFYYVPAANASSTSWTLNIEGGGWCYDEAHCYDRSKTSIGTSTQFRPTAGCGSMNVGSDPWIDSDAHCVFLPCTPHPAPASTLAPLQSLLTCALRRLAADCDGASFSGFRPEPWAVPGKNTTVTFRGIKNLDATVEWALAHGLDKATQFVLTGGSAGGLSTFLHADRVIAKVRAASPAVVAWAAPVVGYFLDHDNFAHSSGTPNTPSFTHANYTTWMKYVYAMQNLTFGADGGLTAACEAKHADAPHLCFMSPHMVDVVKAPLYIFNSKCAAAAASDAPPRMPCRAPVCVLACCVPWDITLACFLGMHASRERASALPIRQV